MVGTVKSREARPAMVQDNVFAPQSWEWIISGPPRLLFMLNITFANGEEMQVFSDQSWIGRQGSILRDSVYNGEAYDARNDRADWARVGLNDSLSAWIMAESMPTPVDVAQGGQLTLQDMPPIRAGIDALHLETDVRGHLKGYLKTSDIGVINGASLTDGGVLKPIRLWQPTTGYLFFEIKISFMLERSSGINTFDMGQNMAGWCRVKLRAAFGVSVYFRHAEILAQPVVATR